MRRRGHLIILTLVAAIVAATPVVVQGRQYTDWGTAMPESAINTGAAEGCPIESPDGLSLYIASNRPRPDGTSDPNDIWVASRSSVAAEWGPMVNLGEPVNSAAADYCPTPLTGKRLLFVSARSNGNCGAGGDIYLARLSPALGWTDPRNLGCAASGAGPNFPTGEFGPSLVDTAEGTFLYFSSAGSGGDQDIYVSRMLDGWTFGPPSLVSELSDPDFDDFMPNVSRNGLEVVFNSSRPDGEGGQDIWTSSRASTADPWGPPMNVRAVNTPGAETRASLSSDGSRLHFGRDGDIHVSTRAMVTGSD